MTAFPDSPLAGPEDDDRNTPRGMPTCEECEGRPGETTSHGVCSECGAGTCKTCEGEGVTYERTGVDTEREYACGDCQDVEALDERDDGDWLHDCRRDDLLSSRAGRTDSIL